MATIVLLHGWGRGAKSFLAVKELLENQGHKVHCFDLPGFGVVGPPPSPWAVDDYAGFVRDFIKRKGLRDFYLFGHSFGGRIGIKLAAQDPELLKGLILCDAAGITPRPQAKVSVFKLFSRIGNWIFSFPVLAAFRGVARRFVYWLSGEQDYYFLQNDVMRETFRRVIEEQLNEYLAKIKAPTLIIWGKLDRMTPIADAHTIHRSIPGSRLEILDGVGHSPHVEATEKLAALIDDFIK